MLDASNPSATLVRIVTEPADVALFQLLAMSRQAPVEIEDARWNPADQRSALLLVRCQQ